MHRPVIALAAAVAVATMLGACSSAGSGGSASPGGSSSSAPAGSSAGAASGGASSRLHSLLPARIQKSGTLTMATDATIGAPFASFGSDNKTIVGVNVDIANALGKVLGVKIEVKNTPFGTFIPGLQAKRYDFSVSVMLDTKEREQVVDFIDYIKDGSGFLVRSGDSHDNLQLGDMCGMKAAAISGSVEQEDLQAQSKKCTAAGKKAVSLSVFAENAQGILALTSGRVDAWTGDSDQNAWFKQQNNGAVKQSGVPFGAGIDGIAVLKGSPLLTPIQKALQMLMDDGTYKQILARYGIQDSALGKATLNNAQA
jgi:polar amino acid transport system substrate-binding protein